MLASSYRLPFRLAGIPLYLHISFLLVLPFLVWAASHNIALLGRELNLGVPISTLQGSTGILLGLITVIGLFISVVLHELGHSLVARRYGVKVRRITLWFLGGVAEFEEMPRQRGAEAVVGIAGPIVSFVLAAIFCALTFIIPKTIPAVWIIIYYLAAINLMLGLFNLLPAMPMDGGRILRSLLALKMPHPRATLIAGNVSKILALAMGLLGALSFNWWLVILAIFVFTAVKSETQQTVVLDLLRGVSVDEIMTHNVTTVPAYVTVGQLSSFVLNYHHSAFPVVDEHGRLIGTVGVEQMQNIHPDIPVWQIMSTQILTIPQHAPALQAFAEMTRNHIDRLIVLSDTGQISGIITRSDLLRVIEVRMTSAQPGQAPPPNYIPPGTPFKRYPPSAPVG